MPTILVERGLRWFFYSRENREPAHVHVEHGDSVAKFWLTPVSLASNRGFASHELKRLRLMAVEHRITFLERWNAHFGTDP